MNSPGSRDRELFQRIHEDLVDSFDEELEMEVEDGMLPEWRVPETQTEKETAKAERRAYFRELFRMQGELVKLQEWAVATGHKLVVLFEGRDAAGKGGVIKRIAQRLNPRVCSRRATRPEQPRADPVVFPALYHASSGGRRNRAV